MRLGYILAVNVAFGFATDLEEARTASAQSMATDRTNVVSVGFSNPQDMNALLAYRLPDWGYRTISLQFSLFGHGEKNSGCPGCPGATAAAASENLQLSWYRESERRTWSWHGSQNGIWNWDQTSDRQPDDIVESQLSASLSLGTLRRDYVAGNFFMRGNASVEATYEEARAHEDTLRALALERTFRANLGLGVGVGRIRDVTPVLQAQRISERLKALGREPLSQDDVLRLASVFAQAGGYYRVFDRPNRQLWQDVLEPLVVRGEMLTPFEVYYLGDVFYEQLGSRREGFTIEVSGQVQRDTRDDGYTYGSTYWGPSVSAEWDHNLSLDHQLSAFMSATYFWGDYDGPMDREVGIASLTFQHQWVVADRMLWINSLNGNLFYNEVPRFLRDERLITRDLQTRFRSEFSFYVENHLRLGPRGEVTWRHYETDPRWTENLAWNLELNVIYDLENALF